MITTKAIKDRQDKARYERNRKENLRDKNRGATTKATTAYEKAIKNAILYNQELFADIKPLGKSTVLFEKVCGQHLIADCLIFSQNRGIIGVEIKTAHDTLKRLSKQLDDYVRVCTYVYVFVHDSHTEAVIELLRKKGLISRVGVISYEEFDGEIVAGVYQRAYKSDKYNLSYALDMMWKEQIYDIIRLNNNRQERLLANTTQGLAAKQANSLGSRYSATGRKSSKAQLKRTYINMFGEVWGTRMLVDQFQNPSPTPDRVLRLYHFISEEEYHKLREQKGVSQAIEEK